MCVWVCRRVWRGTGSSNACAWYDGVISPYTVKHLKPAPQQVDLFTICNGGFTSLAHKTSKMNILLDRLLESAHSSVECVLYTVMINSSNAYIHKYCCLGWQCFFLFRITWRCNLPFLCAYNVPYGSIRLCYHTHTEHKSGGKTNTNLKCHVIRHERFYYDCNGFCNLIFFNRTPGKNWNSHYRNELFYIVESLRYMIVGNEKSERLEITFFLLCITK